MGKKWYSSKTMSFAAALAAVGLAMLSVPQVQDFVATMPDEQQGITTLIIAAIVAGLRVVTSSAITK